MAPLTMGQDLKRPLPPPQSRETVLSEVEGAGSWVSLDEFDEIQVCVPYKRAKLDEETIRYADSNSLSSTSSMLYRGGAINSTNDTNSQSCVGHTPGDTLKKRLFSSSKTSRHVTESNEFDLLQLPGEVGPSGGEKVAAGVGHKAADEGHASSRDDEGEQTVFEDGQDDGREEAMRLAMISHWSFSMINNEIQAIDEDRRESFECRPTDPVQEKKERTEREGGERSRELREQALARRARHEVVIRHPSLETNFNASTPGPSPYSSGECSIRHTEQQAIFVEESPTPRAMISPDLDELFELAREAAHDDDESKQNKKWAKMPSSVVTKALHPASRAAAEQYRTQDRHIVAPNQNERLKFDQTQSLEERESRLRKFTSLDPRRRDHPESQCLESNFGNLKNSIRPSRPSVEKAATEVKPLASSVAAAATDASRSNERPTPFDSHLPSHSTSPVVRNNSVSPRTERPQPANDLAQLAQTSIFSARPPSEIFLSRPQTVLIAEEAVGYLPQGELFLKPRGFEKWSEKYQTIVKEHEVEKERLRDLEAIMPTFEQIAKFGTLDQFSSRERSEVSFAQGFLKAVVNQNLSGKRMRKRMSDIQSNMKRRVQKRAPEEELQCGDLLDRLLKPEQRDHIRQLITEAQSRIEVLSCVRAEAGLRKFAGPGKDTDRDRSISKARKERKRVGFSDSMIDNVDHSDPTTATTTKKFHRSTKTRSTHDPTETRRMAQYAALDRYEDKIRAAFDRFTHPNDEICKDLSADRSYGREEAHTDNVDNASVTSEEDEGAEFQSRIDPLLLNKSSTFAENDVTSPRGNTVSIEQQRQQQQQQPRQEGDVQTQMRTQTQSKDIALATAMRRKEEQRAILRQQQAQQPSSELLCQAASRVSEQDVGTETRAVSVNSVEFDDLDSEIDRNHDEYTGEQVCYRYTLKSMYCKIPGYDDAVEYVSAHYLHLATAQRDLAALRDEVRLQYNRSQNREHIRARTDCNELDGQHDTMVEFAGGQAYFRAWIERQEYNPSKQAYQDARVKKACHAKPVYLVSWERTRRPIRSRGDESDEETEDVTTSTELQQTEHADPIANDDHDLFGDEPPLSSQPTENPSKIPEPPTTPPPQVTGITLDALRFYTNIAQANRLAKEIFMQWYMDHLRGHENHRLIAREEMLVEQQLESYGDITMWEREDDFDVRDDNGDDELEEGRESSGSWHNDRLRVWVMEKPLMGPAN